MQNLPVETVTVGINELHSSNFVFEALVQIGLCAIAQVVGLSLAVPGGLSTLSGDLADLEVGNKRELQRSGEGAGLAPDAHVLGSADRTNINRVGRVLCKASELQGGLAVNGDGLNSVGIIFANTASNLPQVLLLGTGSPSQGSAVINNVGGCEVGGTRASNAIDLEGGENARRGNGTTAASTLEFIDDASIGGRQREAGLIGIASCYPNQIVVNTVAQINDAFGIVVIGCAVNLSGNEEVSNQHIGTGNENLEVVVVPAVTIAVGEDILNFTHVSLVASGRSE